MNLNLSLITEFKDFLKQQKRSTSTITAYSKDITQLFDYKKVNFSTLKEKDIKDFLKELEDKEKITKKTISRKLNSINTFFKFLEKKGAIKINPSKTIEHPKYKQKLQRFLKKSEYNHLRQSTRENRRLNVMIEVLLQTGIRISELSELAIGNIDFNDRKLTIVNLNETRIIPLNDKIYYLLKDYIEISGSINPSLTVFRTKNNKKIQIRNIRSAIDKAMLAAKIKSACVNDLRNTFIVEQLSAGLPITKVAKFVGHKNLNSTKRYLDCLAKKYKESDVEDVVEL